MNADHRDAINLYATRLLGAEPADWRCTGCDPDGIDLQAGATTLRLDFPERVTGPGELRRMLVRLADEARAKAIADGRPQRLAARYTSKAVMPMPEPRVQIDCAPQ